MSVEHRTKDATIDAVWATAHARLTEREVDVIARRFVDDETLEQVGMALGISRSRVTQIEVGALRRIWRRATWRENAARRRRGEAA